MRTFDQPPKPPEWNRVSPRAVIIAMLGFIAYYRWTPSHQHDILLRAPVQLPPKKPLPSASVIDYRTSDTKKAYDSFALLLKEDIESISRLTFLLKQIEMQFYAYPDGWGVDFISMLHKFIDLATNGESKLTELFGMVRDDIGNGSFATTFGYDGVVRGWSDEAIALLPSGDKSPLYLGMPIRYEKKNVPENPLFDTKNTGELTGAGKIMAFHITKNTSVIDRVIEVEGRGEEGPFRTFLTPDEIFVD